MRRTLVLASIACFSPALASGCFSASSGGGSPDANFTQPDGEAFDSSMNEPDTSVDSSTPDVTMEAAMPEAAIDSGVHEAEAGPSPVVVNVTSASGPENGVVVVFQDASGNVVSPTSTTGGTASFLAAAGSQVTVVMGTADIPYLVTIQGIAPGDVLAVYDPTSDLAYVGDQVNVDSVPNQPAASSYTVALGVGCTSTAADFPIQATAGPGCVVGGQASVLVSADNVPDGGSEYTWQTGLALSDAGPADAAITNPWTSAIATVDMTGTLPASAYQLYGTAQLEMIAGGVPFGASGGTTSQWVMDPDAGLNATFTYPQAFAAGVQLETGLFGNNTYPNVPVSTVATRSAPTADASVAIDYSQLPPSLASAMVDTTNPSQPVVTWSPNDAGALAGSDGIVISLLWQTSLTTRWGGMWTLVAPPTSTQVQVPLLPSGVTAFVTDGGAFFEQPPTVAYVQTSFVAGYAGLRAQAGTAGLTSLMVAADRSNNGGYFGGSVVPPLPADGTLQLSAVTRAGD